jgi:hypothetical protein
MSIVFIYNFIINDKTTMLKAQNNKIYTYPRIYFFFIETEESKFPCFV